MLLIRALVIVLIGAPVAAGAGLTLLAALGWQPGQGEALGVDIFAATLGAPGVGRGLVVTALSGLGAALIALAATLPLGFWIATRPGAARWLAPMLALPHAAFAIGLAFLIAPSGWIVRAIAPVVGWDVLPAIVTLGDPYGLALLGGLALKEMPFLLLMVLAGLAPLDWRAQMLAGRACGYGAAQVWRLVIWPQLWRSLRLPMAIVLGYGLSVTDMALILGPSHPPSLAVQALRLYTAPDLSGIGPGAVLSVVILALWAGAMGIGLIAERGIAGPGRALARRVLRGARCEGSALGGAVFTGLATLTGGALLALALWSVARRWPFPAPLPTGIDFAQWARGGWAAPLLGSLGVGAAVSLLSLGLAVLVLEAESRTRQRLGLGPLLLAPLVLPQIGFLQGLTTAFLWLGLPPGALAVIWAGLVLGFPYALLVLAGPWRGLDPGLPMAAAGLGAGPGRVFLRIRLPLMARPLALALATAFAVSVAQYLAVLLPGAGRVPSLATEAVALASGADRRLAAQMGLLQAVLPLAAFALALLPGRRLRDL